MTPASEIAEGVEQALRNLLEDEDILRDIFALFSLSSVPRNTPVPEVAPLVYKQADSMIEHRRERSRASRKDTPKKP